jgi:hypothetical protein
MRKSSRARNVSRLYLRQKLAHPVPLHPLELAVIDPNGGRQNACQGLFLQGQKPEVVRLPHIGRRVDLKNVLRPFQRQVNQTSELVAFGQNVIPRANPCF